MGTKEVKEEDRKRLTFYIGECWHEKARLEYWYEESERMGGCVCHACNQEIGYSPSHRTFTTWPDFGRVVEVLKEKGDWGEFIDYAYREFTDRKLFGSFTTWLFTDPARFCGLVAEWLKQKD